MSIVSVLDPTTHAKNKMHSNCGDKKNIVTTGKQNLLTVDGRLSCCCANWKKNSQHVSVKHVSVKPLTSSLPYWWSHFLLQPKHRICDKTPALLTWASPACRQTAGMCTKQSPSGWSRATFQRSFPQVWQQPFAARSTRPKRKVSLFRSPSSRYGMKNIPYEWHNVFWRRPTLWWNIRTHYYGC